MTQDLEHLTQIAAKLGITPESVRIEEDSTPPVDQTPSTPQAEPEPARQEPQPVFTPVSPPVQLQSLNADQASFALGSSSELKMLPNGKAIDQRELELYNMIRQTELAAPNGAAALAPRASDPMVQSQNQPLNYGNPEPAHPASSNSSYYELKFTQAGIIALVCLAMGFSIIAMTLIRVWGTTDTARNEEYANRMERSFDELGKRYDRLARATEKVGKKADVCVAFVCGTKQESQSEPLPDTVDPIKPEPIVPDDYNNAVIQIRAWQRQKIDARTIQSYIAWVEANPEQGYPSSEALRRAYDTLMNRRQPGSISAQNFRG